MEYQKQDENGQLQWYTLVGDSAIPKKVKLKILHFTRKNSRTDYYIFLQISCYKLCSHRLFVEQTC